VAEICGIPDMGQRSLEYCMENMWLKAIELGIGMQIVSIVSQLALNPDFYKLIGIEYGNYNFDECAIGYLFENFIRKDRTYNPDIVKFLK
jgi:nitroreductase